MYMSIDLRVYRVFALPSRDGDRLRRSSVAVCARDDRSDRGKPEQEDALAISSFLRANKLTDFAGASTRRDSAARGDRTTRRFREAGACPLGYNRFSKDARLECSPVPSVEGSKTCYKCIKSVQSASIGHRKSSGRAGGIGTKPIAHRW